MTVGLSVVTAKAYAVILGPAGVGLYGLMLSVLNLGVIVVSVGMGVSVVQATAAAVAAKDWSLVHAVRRTARILAVIGGAVGGVLLIGLREPIAKLVLGDATKDGDVVILAGALLLTVAAGAQLALLTGLHRVKAVTLVNVASALVSAGAGVALVALVGIAALAPALLLTAAVQAALSVAVNRRSREAGIPSPRGTTAIPGVVGTLVRRGARIAASQLVSTGVQLGVPVMVLQMLGTQEVGYYRAAATISVGYLTFFLASLTQDYLPRIAGASDSGAMILLIDRRMRLVMSLGLPIILGLLALGPLAIQLLYSSAFAPALDVLQWQLVGDIVRLPAWVLAFVLLTGDGGPYFRAELTGGIALALGSILGLATLGLTGAGVGYAAAQVAYYAVLWMLVRRRLPLRPGRLQMGLLLTSALCAAVLLLDVATVPRLVIFGTATLALAAYAWPRAYLLQRRGEL